MNDRMYDFTLKFLLESDAAVSLWNDVGEQITDFFYVDDETESKMFTYKTSVPQTGYYYLVRDGARLMMIDRVVVYRSGRTRMMTVVVGTPMDMTHNAIPEFISHCDSKGVRGVLLQHLTISLNDAVRLSEQFATMDLPMPIEAEVAKMEFASAAF
jgi:hypothetical protein